MTPLYTVLLNATTHTSTFTHKHTHTCTQARMHAHTGGPFTLCQKLLLETLHLRSILSYKPLSWWRFTHWYILYIKKKKEDFRSTLFLSWLVSVICQPFKGFFVSVNSLKPLWLRFVSRNFSADLLDTIMGSAVLKTQLLRQDAKTCRNLGPGSIHKVLAGQAQGPKFRTPAPM